MGATTLAFSGYIDNGSGSAGTTLTVPTPPATPLSVGGFITGSGISAGTKIVSGSGTSFVVNNSQLAGSSGALVAMQAKNYVAPTVGANVSLTGSIGPTWLTFRGGFSSPSSYPAVYTPSAAAAGSFTTGADFSQYSAINAVLLVSGVNATKTYAPGAEGLLWNLPSAIKRQVTSSTKHNVLVRFAIGQNMSCSSGWGLNCDLSRDVDNFHQLMAVGRWADGNNYASSSSTDEQYSNNFIADDIETGPLGETLFDPNFESTESGSTHYGLLMYCASQNATSMFGGYVGGGHMCVDPINILPPQPANGPASFGLNAGQVQGANLAAGVLCCNHSFTVQGGNDGLGGVSLGGGGGSIFNALTFDTVSGNTGTVSALGYNVASKEWWWYQGAGVPAVAMKFVNSNSVNYSGAGVNTLAAPPGILMGGDQNTGNQHLFGMANSKPSAFWHLPGDFQLISNAVPGAMGGWYSVGGSTNLTGILSGTTLTVQQEIDPTPLPTPAAPGSGYAPGPGNLTGTLTGTFAGCTTEPVLNVTASGATGGVIAITGVATRGVCPPPVTNGPTTSWTPGGALAAGTGASVNINWEQALNPQFTNSVPPGPPGLHQLLAGTGVIANTHIISGSGNTWTVDQTYGSPIGPETISGSSWYPAMAISNDPVNPDFTATTLRSGSSANKDLTGRIALVGGAATFTLTGIYATPPDCVTADVTTPANSNSVLESLTTLTFSGTGTDTLKWVCAGRN